MNKYMCITDICDFVYEQSKKIMKGTKHKNDWFFYHDALPLFVNKDCRAYMKKKV